MKNGTIEGLPEGWKAIAYRFGKFGESYLFNGKVVTNSFSKTEHPVLIVEKIQPSKIVLEEIIDHSTIEKTDLLINGVWRREVNETDEEPYLKLNKKDMLELIEHIKLGGQLNYKITEFLKENL